MIIVLCGPGGVGKGTVASRLADEVSSLTLSVSWTTRQRRRSEADTAYHFVTRAEFEQAIVEDRFVEWAEFNGELYGTPRFVVDPSMDVLLEIDVQGAHSIKSFDPSSFIILLVPPQVGTLSQRMRSRGDDEEIIATRVALAEHEITSARSIADAVVVNEHLDEAVMEIATIIEDVRFARRSPS